MIDIDIIRNNPKIIKNDLKKRYQEDQVSFVDDLIELDKDWRKLKQKADNLRQERNEISLEINKVKKRGESVSELIKAVKEIPIKIDELDNKIRKTREDMDFILRRLPNIIHKSVPTGKDESKNKVIRTNGKKTIIKDVKSHTELIKDLDLVDIERAAKVSGARFYYLKNELVELDHALQRFALDILKKKKFTLIQTPEMLNKKAIGGAVDLIDFKDVIYKIDGEDLYLIGTAEHPLAALHMNEILKKEDLPLKYAGLSTCYRKEAGTHGQDTKGIFRVHEFRKVEQFIYSEPKDSWKLHDELLSNAEEIMKKLKIPYRVVNIASGALNDTAAKKYDIEAWFPAQKEYKEVVSCSNCTDYQSRNLNIRYKDGDKMIHPHLLNSTAVATTRLAAAIIENYQHKDSIKMPTVLHKYLGFSHIKK